MGSVVETSAVQTCWNVIYPKHLSYDHGAIKWFVPTCVIVKSSSLPMKGSGNAHHDASVTTCELGIVVLLGQFGPVVISSAQSPELTLKIYHR